MLEQALCIKAAGSDFFTSMCCRSDGCYMVINGATNRIHIFSASGQWMEANFGNRLFNKRFTTPALITELLNKRIAVYDRSDNTVKKLTWASDLEQTFHIGMNTFSLTTNVYGHMVMGHQTDNKMRLVTIRCSDTGHVLHSVQFKPSPAASFDTPFYTVYQQAGYMYTLDQQACSLTQRTIDGAKVKAVGKRGFVLGHLSDPTSLCLDFKQHVIVSDSRNNRVVRFDMDDNSDRACQVLVSDISRPLYVNFDPSNNLLVMTAKSLMVFSYDMRVPEAPKPPLVNLMDRNEYTPMHY